MTSLCRRPAPKVNSWKSAQPSRSPGRPRARCRLRGRRCGANAIWRRRPGRGGCGEGCEVGRCVSGQKVVACPPVPPVPVRNRCSAPAPTPACAAASRAWWARFDGRPRSRCASPRSPCRRIRLTSFLTPAWAEPQLPRRRRLLQLALLDLPQHHQSIAFLLAQCHDFVHPPTISRSKGNFLLCSTGDLFTLRRHGIGVRLRKGHRTARLWLAWLYHVLPLDDRSGSTGLGR